MAPTHLQILAKRYPNVPAVLAELANLEAVLTLPKPAVHVVSDVHGEYVKLRQVVNNASGSLRPLFERLFADRLTTDEVEQLLTLVYYPRETWTQLVRDVSQDRRRELLHWVAGSAVIVMRDLARHYSIKYVERIVPDPFDALFRELMFADELARQPEYLDRLFAPFLHHERDTELVRMIAHVIRNLAVGELVVAGDLGDRGPRIDKVIELVSEQPNVSITWGNHDVNLDGGVPGPPRGDRDRGAAVRATSGWSSSRMATASPLEPVARLVREAYADDPATCFRAKTVADDRRRQRRTDAGAHAKGDGDPAVQARGPAVRAPDRVEPRAPRAAPPHRSRDLDGRDRRPSPPAARQPVPHDRLDRSERADRQRGALPRRADPGLRR